MALTLKNYQKKYNIGPSQMQGQAPQYLRWSHGSLGSLGSLGRGHVVEAKPHLIVRGMRARAIFTNYM